MSVAEIESYELGLEPSTGGLWRDAWSRLRRNRAALVGFGLVISFVLMAILAPVVAPYGPRDQNLELVVNGCCPGPSGAHLLGVDQLGRDELSRILWGARYSLVIGFVAVTVGMTFGLILGSIAGYLGGFVDSLIMRLMDIMLAIPGLLLAIGLVAVLGPGLWQIMIAVGIVNVPDLRPPLARIGPCPEGDRFRARRPCGRSPETDDPRRPHPPELDLAVDRPGHPRAGDRDHRRRRARLPRARPSGSVDARVGHDADPGRHATCRARPSSRSPRALRSSSSCSAST